MVAFTHPPNPSLDTQTHHLDPYPPRDPIDLPSTTTIPIKIGFMGLCFTIWWWLMNISHPGLQLINEKKLINGLLVVNDLPCHSPPPTTNHHHQGGLLALSLYLNFSWTHPPGLSFFDLWWCEGLGCLMVQNIFELWLIFLFFFR